MWTELNGSGLGAGACFCERALNRVLLGCDAVWFLRWIL